MKLPMLALCLIWAAVAGAQEQKSGAGSAGRPATVGAVTPIYGQLVMFSYPAGFKHAHANDTGSYYIQESVLAGETVEKWSQMITVTGSKGLASNANVTPQRVIENVAAGFQRACPGSFRAVAVGTLKVSGHDAFTAFVACGAVQSGVARSESALLVAVKGTTDYYTIQWAERGARAEQAPVFDGDKWLARLKQLYPLKLCPRAPGEPEPYPSCINQKE